MRFRPAALLSLAAAVLLAAAAAPAQVSGLSRCRAAVPCSIPFSVQSRPDPLLAAQYGSPSSTALSVQVTPGEPIALSPDRPSPMSEDPVDAAVRAFVRRHPRLPAPNRR
jgi:hypothetical protein